MKPKNEKKVAGITREEQGDPTVAPSMEMDELEVDASPKEIKEGDSTSVTKLVVTRYDD